MQRSMCLFDYPLLKWKTYSTPAERAVSYSFLLRQKREFQQFIDQLGNQVPFHNGISSCYLIDKMYSTADRKNINIYIFDSYKSLQLEISIPIQYLRRKIHLLIHLSSKNNAVFKLEDQCMYIKCKEGQIWKTFYNFSEFLFQKSSEIVIGVKFYTPLICKYLITKELSFLLSMCSRCIFVNTRQTLNTTSISKPPLCALIKACPKNGIKPNELLKHRIASKKADSKTMLELQMKQTPSIMSLKRKLDSENNSRIKTQKVPPEFCKKVMCQCHERNKWKVFKQVRKQPPINYTEILEVEGMLDSLELSQILSNEPEKSNNFKSLKVYRNDDFEIGSNEKTNSKFGFTKNIELSLKSSHKFMDIASEMDLSETENISIENEFQQSTNLSMAITNEKVISQKPNKEILKDNSVSHSETDNFSTYNKMIYPNDKFEEVGKKYCNDSLIIQVKDKCREMIMSPKDSNLVSKGNSNLLPVSSVVVQAVSNKKCKSTHKWPIESQNTHVSEVIMSTAGFQTISVSQQPLGFLTAAGKSLNVSEKAIMAAQKMFEEVCSQEIDVLGDMARDTLPSTSVSKKPVYPGENCLENEFNCDLADKFFEEMPFDDKEVESKPKESFVQVSNFSSVKPQVGKVRKSLGGRRSLKPYSLQK